MKTKHPIEYRRYYKTTIIPAGTKVIPASNLPYPQSEGFWAEPWENMSDEEDSWQRNYGFFINPQDVT